MSWIAEISNCSKWVVEQITNVAGRDQMLDGAVLYFHNFKVKADSYIILGRKIKEIDTLLLAKNRIHLKYEGYFENDVTTYVLIYKSSSGPNLENFWTELRWAVWNIDGDFPWIDTRIQYKKINEQIINNGIDTFKSSHKLNPNCIVINPHNSQYIFSIKQMATKMQLSLIVEKEVAEDELVILFLPSSPDDGEYDDSDNKESIIKNGSSRNLVGKTG